MGFGTQQQVGNRTGITNQTSLADLIGGGGNITPQPPTFPGGGNISPPGLGQDGQQNQLFQLLQQLLSGQGGGQQTIGQGFGMQPPQQTPLPGTKPPIGFSPPPGKDFGGNITPIGIGQPPSLGGSLDVMPRGFGNTPLSQLSNPFGSLINQKLFR